MEIIFTIALIFLSLVGYSTGAVYKAGKSIELKPRVIDLVLVVAIWAIVIVSRLTIDFNRWLLILTWLMVGIGVGILVTWTRKLPNKAAVETGNNSAESSEKRQGIVQNTWTNWRSFSKRLGIFQTRIVLSLIFFIFVTPFALGVIVFSDPLNIKKRHIGAHWLGRVKTDTDLEYFRRQY